MNNHLYDLNTHFNRPVYSTIKSCVTILLKRVTVHAELLNLLRNKTCKDERRYISPALEVDEQITNLQNKHYLFSQLIG